MNNIVFIWSGIRCYILITYKFNFDIIDYLEGNLYYEPHLIAILALSDEKDEVVGYNEAL